MKIKANIPVEKLIHNEGYYNYRYELIDVDIIKVLRRPVSLSYNLNRYYYEAMIIPPKELHCDFNKHLSNDNLYTVNIVRRKNIKWKPPIFEKGVNIYIVRLI